MARDILWDTAPKVHTYIVLNFHKIKRQVNSKNFRLIDEIQSQFNCYKMLNHTELVTLINKKEQTPVSFAIKLVKKLSC